MSTFAQGSRIASDRLSKHDPAARLRRDRDLHLLHPPPDLTMNILYAFSAIVALGLSIYLTVALLKPEWFE
jgi:K+-transporting ATPase KdpF subunit